MAPVNNRPFLEYVLDQLENQGIAKAILAVGYKYEVIMSYFGKKYKNIDLIYSIENEPLGTGGAIKKALNYVATNNIFIVNGDTYSNPDLKKMLKKHIDDNANLTIAVKTMKNFDRYGQVISKNDRIIGFKEKEKCKIGNINVGTYIIKKDFFENTKLPMSFSFESDIMEKYCSKRNFIQYLSKIDFIDIGIPEDYNVANEILKKKWESDYE